MIQSRLGFTLIELLIVVAIIGILAAIAVPNFLNAQLRARIARTNSDLRSLSIALESYFVDRGKYPPNQSHLTIIDLRRLTTPVSYIASVGFKDIFKAEQQNKAGQMTGNNLESYLFFNYRYEGNNWITQIGSNYKDFSTNGYCLSSWGPDRLQDAIEWVYVLSRSGNGQDAQAMIYAPSNGLISGGDIGRWGGDVTGVPVIAGG